MLVADADVAAPVITALKTVRYPIVTYEDINAPVRPDTALMRSVLQHGGILVTRDTGIPSQAYVARYAQNGLTIVLLRWKTSTYLDYQQMVETILRDGHKWEAIASQVPSVISASHRGFRSRPWTDVPDSISQTTST